MLSHFGGSSKHKRKWTDNQIKNMKDRVLSGESYRSIAKDYNTSGASIHSALSRHNPVVKEEYLPYGYATIKEYCEEHGELYNAVYWHIKHKHIDSVIYKNKVYVPLNSTIKRRTISDDKIDKILELYGDMVKKKEIANMVGVNIGTVNNYIKLFTT